MPLSDDRVTKITQMAEAAVTKFPIGFISQEVQGTSKEEGFLELELFLGVASISMLRSVYLMIKIRGESNASSTREDAFLNAVLGDLGKQLHQRGINKKITITDVKG